MVGGGVDVKMEDVLTHLYKRYSASVFNFLVYFTGNRQASEDLVQETFLRVMQYYANFEGRSHPKTWILKIAKNVAIDYERRRRLPIFNSTYESDRFDQLQSVTNTEEEVLDRESVERIIQAINSLRPQYRLAIILRGIEGLSTAQVAEILNWSEAKVKTTLHRARQQLLKRLERKEAEKSVFSER